MNNEKISKELKSISTLISGKSVKVEELYSKMKKWKSGLNQFLSFEKPEMDGEWVVMAVRTKHYNDEDAAEKDAMKWLKDKLKSDKLVDGKDVVVDTGFEEKGWISIGIKVK